MEYKNIELKVEAVMRGGLSCTEALLNVFNNEFGLGLDDKALRMATGFAGGVGGRKDICGGLTGIILVIGAIKGRISPDESKKEAMELSGEVYDEFLSEFGSVYCCEILKDPLISCPGRIVPTCARILIKALGE